MKARAAFAALAAMFARPSFNDAPALTHERVAEGDGLSAHSTFRIRAAFERFARFMRGEGA